MILCGLYTVFVDLSKSDPFSNETMLCVGAASLSDVGSSVITLAMEEKLISEVCNTVLAHLLFGILKYM